jgi:hypothetical protein
VRALERESSRVHLAIGQACLMAASSWKSMYGEPREVCCTLQRSLSRAAVWGLALAIGRIVRQMQPGRRSLAGAAHIDLCAWKLSRQVCQRRVDSKSLAGHVGRKDVQEAFSQTRTGHRMARIVASLAYRGAADPI